MFTLIPGIIKITSQTYSKIWLPSKCGHRDKANFQLRLIFPIPNNGHVHSSSRDTGDIRDKEGWGDTCKTKLVCLQSMKTTFYKSLHRVRAQLREVKHLPCQQSHWYCPGDCHIHWQGSRDLKNMYLVLLLFKVKIKRETLPTMQRYKYNQYVQYPWQLSKPGSRKENNPHVPQHRV